MRKNSLPAHYKAILATVIVLLFAGYLSFAFIESIPPLAAISASVSAGCVTGIVFYAITNLRSNEIQKSSKEYKDIVQYYELTRETMTLCDLLNGKEKYEKEDFQLIYQNMDKFQEYWDTMLNEIDINVQLMLSEEGRKEYVKKMTKAIASINRIMNNGFEGDEDEINKEAKESIRSVSEFCVETLKNMTRPMLDLMYKANCFEKSAF